MAEKNIPEELKKEIDMFSVSFALLFITSMPSNDVLKEKYDSLLSKGLTKEDVFNSPNPLLQTIKSRIIKDYKRIPELMAEGKIPESTNALLISMIAELGEESPEVLILLDELTYDILESYILK